jgi:hypothetical protein
MGRYQVHRSDANAPLIIDAMRKVGACVEPLGRPVDVLVTVADQVAIAEIKTARGKTRSAAQEAFLKRWRGPCPVLRTPEDGIALVGELRWMASVLQRVGWPREKAEE